MCKLMFATLITLTAASASAQYGDTPIDRLGGAGSQDGAMRASTASPAYAQYRRSVLGDTSVIHPAMAKPDDERGRWVAGSYALWLMHNGMAKTEALAQAQRIGERPRFVENESSRDLSQLSSYETYQRAVLGSWVGEIERSRPAAPQQ
jgi:hypothetical protein